jgi:5-formyltetrahydrofolate cyclo-ligase
MNLAQQKEILRREARTRRAGLKAAAPDAARAIAKNFISSLTLYSNVVIAGYVAAHDEIDPAELIKALRWRGAVIALPRVTAKGEPLAFHRWDQKAAPVKGAYGLFEAAPDWPLIAPDVVLVPLLAFDAEGYRLGYGGGYYDRSLRTLREKGSVLAVGIAYDGQKIAHVPHNAMDEQLDWIVTEKSAQPLREIDQK